MGCLGTLAEASRLAGLGRAELWNELSRGWRGHQKLHWDLGAASSPLGLGGPAPRHFQKPLGLSGSFLAGALYPQTASPVASTGHRGQSRHFKKFPETRDAPHTLQLEPIHFQEPPGSLSPDASLPGLFKDKGVEVGDGAQKGPQNVQHTVFLPSVPLREPP